MTLDFSAYIDATLVQGDVGMQVRWYPKGVVVTLKCRPRGGTDFCHDGFCAKEITPNCPHKVRCGKSLRSNVHALWHRALSLL